MLLFDKSQAEIWRMLLPEKWVLYPQNGTVDDLIFTYRNYIYFVHEDGAVVRMNKPDGLRMLTDEDLWERLFHDQDTFDYEDHGMFTIGAILEHMGFMLPIKKRTGVADYHVDIVDGMDKEVVVEQLELYHVSFEFALFYSLLQCHQLDKASLGEMEHEIQQIVRGDLSMEQRKPL